MAELHRWWLTALRSHPERVADGVDHDEYVSITWLIFKSLVPSYDAREAAASCEEDWISDSKGAAILNRSLFLDAVSSCRRASSSPTASTAPTRTPSVLTPPLPRHLCQLFELADTWTVGVEPDEYVVFLRTLFANVSGLWSTLTDSTPVTVARAHYHAGDRVQRERRRLYLEDGWQCAVQWPRRR